MEVGKVKQNEDLRIVKTKMAIKNAFLQLLSEKSFDKISVADITQYALIHRGTFYSHYTDKYDLLNKLEDELIDEMGEFIELINYESVTESKEKNNPMPHMVPLLIYLEERPEYLNLVIKGNGSTSFFEKMIDKYYDLIMDRVQVHQDNWVEYRKDIIRAIVTSVFSRWTDNGMKENKEDLASWLTSVMLSNWNSR